MSAFPPTLAIQPLDRPVDATVSIPGSKSSTNRALLIAALADGHTTLQEALFSDDTERMVESLARLGLRVEAHPDERRYDVWGQVGRLPASHADLFVGNSGTSARFLTAMLALGHGRYRVDGVPRMRERPIEPLLHALGQLGIRAYAEAGNGCPPLVVEATGLEGGRLQMEGGQSSQYFSALLMVGACARSGLQIEVLGDLVSKPYIDLTAAVMADFGVKMSHENYQVMRVPGGQRYRAREYVVEPDASGASYFFAAAAVTGGRITVRGLGENCAQGDLAFVDVLAQMGCQVERGRDATTVTGPERLRSVDVDMNAVSDMAQTLAAIAPLAEGPTTIRNIAHNRVKETDRIAAVVAELRRLGQEVEEYPDGLRIEPRPVQPAQIHTYDDHRMAMAFAVLGLRAPGVVIEDPACVRKTFPDFFERLDALRQ